MFITLNSQNRTTGSVDVDTPSNFVNMFNENIIIPKNSVVGVHSVSVVVSGDIVIDGTNDKVSIDYGSITIDFNIPHGSYAILEKTSGTNPTTSYPLIDALNHALTNAISNSGMATQLPPANNKFSVVQKGGQVFVRIDLGESKSEIFTSGTIFNSTNTDNQTGSVQFNGNKIKNIEIANTGSGVDSKGVIDGNALRSFNVNGNASANRYGEVIIKPSKSLGHQYSVGMFLQSHAGLLGNAVFDIQTDNKINILETDLSGNTLCENTTTNYSVQADGNMWLKAVLPLSSTGNRIIQYYVNNNATHDEDGWRLVDMSAFSGAQRLQATSRQRYYAGAFFREKAKVRPNAAAMTSSSGQWTISTPGTGVTVNTLMNMSSTTSADGVITNGSVFITSIDGSGGCNGFDMTNSAVLPDAGEDGSFIEGDTITFDNGVVITKTALALTEDIIGAEIEEISATTVVNPSGNPMLRNNILTVELEGALADLLHLPVRDDVSLFAGGSQIAFYRVGSAGLNATSHQPEIFVNCPTLNINSRNNKNSSNTLTRFPLGEIDSQGDRVGHHYHESYNIMYHKLVSTEDMNINQLTIQLQDKDGANLNQLLHPSVVSLHITTPSK